MTGAQLISPTSSQLATVNAIQAAVNASTHWTVNSTGTTTNNYKYIEVKPSNLTSVYKDYRILFVERVNNSANKNYAGANPFNSATAVPVYFAPDGGSSWCTFTPANIDSANPPYVGTRYRFGTSSSSTYNWAGGIISPWTATWFYECEGAMWLINRGGATSHQIMALGSIFVPSRASLTDFNQGGTEVGLPGTWFANGLGSNSIQGPSLIASSIPYIWYQTAAGSPPTKSTVQGTGNPSTRGMPMSNLTTLTNKSFFSSEGGMIALPINWYLDVSASANPGNSAFVFRGVYLTSNIQTRTTIQSGSPASTIGYTFFPDDTAVATTTFALAFLNSP